MDNYITYSQNYVQKTRRRDIHKVILKKNIIFQLFFAEKRYKLIIFAPKFEIVDKLSDALIINK